MNEPLDCAAAGAVPPAIPAATLIIFRRDAAAGAAQILMVERSGRMSFAGGAAVFPGGRVDPADRALAATAAPALAPEDGAARIAAVRETLEETGLLVGLAQRVDATAAAAARTMLAGEGALAPVLARFGWTLALDRLVPFARWLPRHRTMKVFDTRFYLTDLGTGAVELEADAGETTRLFWISPAAALHQADAGRIKVIYPTRRNLERLALFADFAAAKAHAQATPIVTVTPEVVEREGRPWLGIPADAGYPVDGEWLESAERA